ncbi:MAG: hypothetical protein M9921_15195 [Fimbriimonadaceae bacterium]|nr:hypothetical protein [Chthonomonadaceae bacterium]MCO5298193.1 hypothetical protein [Fimbriimonadaceae bacterium]
MPTDDLHRLWKLHKVDLAIVEIRKRAAALDPGREIQAEINALSEQHAKLDEAAKALAGEQHDIELQQKGMEDKIRRFEKELFGGSLKSPREIENLQKEIEMLKRHRGDLDGRLMELWELVPPAKQKAEAVKERLEAKKAELVAHRQKVVKLKETLEADFKVRTGERPRALEGIPKVMLERYERSREKHGGIAMTRITGRPSSCEMCGTLLPERLIEGAKEGRLVECESCHRFLYWNESVL